MEIRMIEGKTFEKLKMNIADLMMQIDTLYVEPDNGWITRLFVRSSVSANVRYRHLGIKD